MNLLHDLDQTIGSDLAASTTGDLLTATGTQRGQQRLLRRLLTNPGEYLFHLDYGAGLPRYVGELPDLAKIRARIRAQVGLEASVAPHPALQIEVKPIADGIAVAIRYVDAITQQPVSLSFQVNK